MATAYEIFHNVPTGNLLGVQFAVYTPEEIKKLSVLEITNTENFDALGHPTIGGLYDPRLGPNDRDELCKTCGQTSMHCTGHLSHINLPLIVFNPLFIRVAFHLVNGTCFSCRQFRSNKVSCLLAAAQLRALEYGLVETAQNMEEAVFEIMGGSDGGGTASVLLVSSKLDEILSKALEGLDLKVTKREALVKNVVDFRRTLIKQFTQNHIAKAPRTCTNCGTQKRNMFLEFNSRIVVGSQAKKKAKAKKIKREPTEFGMEEMVDEEQKEEDEQQAEDDPLEISTGQTYLTPKQAKEHLTKVYQNEKALISQLYAPSLGTDDTSTSPVDGFFIEVLPIAPSRFRPLSYMRDQKFENPHSMSLTRLIQECYVIKSLLYAIQTGTKDFMESIRSIVNKIPGETLVEKLQVAWNNLQRRVNAVFDSDMDRLKSEKFPGVKQLLEKKEGLFRMHMMGKRVNYAARSVISPDPYIDVDEIGVPTVFATKLTYPEVVNQFTADSLKQAVLNGPDVHPGATMVKTEEGFTVFLGRDKVQRQRIANKLFNGTKEDILSGSKIVYRHLVDGDIMLLNRQPTLHKPSIMAHKARVLKGEKTLRLNYSNCKTYNADFDGDEMNAHFPQSEAARSEAYMIANVENQYLVPKDGTPLGGLIQDHIIGAVKLMVRGQFFSRDDYHQLIYSAINKKKGRIQLLPPAIRKPCALWSGKQVVSTVIINAIPKDRNYINLTGNSKIAAKCWQKCPPQKWNAGGTPLRDNEMSENEVIMRNGELLCGILDKSHCGPTQYGLIHCCYELYGGKVASLLLSQLERLFTYYLQGHGFSLGVEDILVTAEADKKRRKVMHSSRELGDEGIRSALKIPDSADAETVRDRLIMAHLSRDDKAMKDIDNAMKSKTDSITNAINKLCMPDGLLKKFPDNNLQLMVLSGAKGSTVNCMQISCLLGQIELEGRRPPLMLSGRSLPSFLPYCTTARAGGFVDGRFLTGIRLQEYFFHCMAGREGLIDTAVKTSRSGYLQRCLIKHLEGVMVAYDMTVRDSDGSVIQFQYGEDGLDIPKLPFLKPNQLSFLVDNFKSVRNDEVISLLKEDELCADVLRHSKKVRKWLSKGGNNISNRSGGFLKFCKKQDQLPKNDLVDMWFELDPAERAKYNRKSNRHFDPVSSVYRADRHFGAISEKLDSVIESYSSSRLTKLSADAFREMMYYKIQTSICQPGEAVGLLAAQSIGEPSTQMTLNTFHFAGRGEMNVTLGIPRLREILMTASAKISTPSVEVPLLDEDEEQREKTGEYLKKRLSRIYLSDVIQKFTIHERLNFNSVFKDRTYVVKFNFLPHKAYRKRLNTKPAKVLRYMEKVFIPGLISAIKTQLRVISNTTMLTNVIVREKSGPNSGSKEEDEAGVDVEDNDTSMAKVEDNDEEESSGAEDVDDEADATANRNRMRHQQDREYEELDEEEKQIRDQTNQSDNDEEDDDDADLYIKKKIKLENSMETDEQESNIEADVTLTETPVEMSDSANKRIQNVLDSSNWISDYKFDARKEEWCELTLKLELSMPRLSISDMVEEQVKKAIVYHVLGIKKAFTVDQNNANGTCQRILKTEGINIKEMFNYENMVDLRRLYSNDIHAVAQTYGIEAAARVVVKEIQNVFLVYGIEVDPRHLLLVADYMTFDGHYKPFNRVGLENSASPLQQMSFESTMHFLKMATLSGCPDMLKSPSSRLVVGRPVSCGTGCFGLVHPIKAVPASQSPLTSCQ